jgi:hypothetical protein
LHLAKEQLFLEPCAKQHNNSNTNNALNDERRLPPKLCRALFKDSAQASVERVHDLIETGKIGGVYVSDVEELCSVHGKDFVVNALERIFHIFCDYHGEVFLAFSLPQSIKSLPS